MTQRFEVSALTFLIMRNELRMLTTLSVKIPEFNLLQDDLLRTFHKKNRSPKLFKFAEIIFQSFISHRSRHLVKSRRSTVGNKELLYKCERGNKIAPLQHKCQEKCAKGVQFYCPSSTYPAIVLLTLYFIAQLQSNF